MNALAAIAVAEIYQVPDKDIAHALHNIVMTGKRQEILHFGDVTVINDAYNASPASMEAACKTLKSVVEAQGKGRALAVMRDMLEWEKHLKKLMLKLAVMRPLQMLAVLLLMDVRQELSAKVLQKKAYRFIM